MIDGPAVADLVVVAGAPESEDVEWLKALWRQVPHPKTLVTLGQPGHVGEELDAGLSLLATGEQGQPEAGRSERSAGAEPSTESGEHHGHGHREQHAHMDHHMHGSDETSSPPRDHAPQDDHLGHEAHDSHEGHEGHEGQTDSHHEQSAHDGHEGHEGHDMHGHGGHDMSEMTVAGLPMADRADDRDGLRLDLLHVPLGPALNDWPCGLVLRVSLQGDVVQHAEVEYVHAGTSQDPFWNEPWLRAVRGDAVTRDSAARRRCGAHLDSLGRFLAVIGWGDSAARARRLRDEVLTHAPTGQLSADLLRLVRQVTRSRTLRWLARGLGPLPAARAVELGVSGPALAADGDAYDRVQAWLEEMRRAVDEFGDTQPLTSEEVTGPRGRVDGARPPSRSLLDALPELLHGVEFAAARVIVASLDPDVDELVAVPAHGAVHG
ncbi:hypothetical protein ACFZCX_22030 [Streptomyces canus]|uniref:hypothetical protein n=2 Tax=Streptomyces TaxID=1883 RepID=UPI0036E297C5